MFESCRSALRTALILFCGVFATGCGGLSGGGAPETADGTWSLLVGTFPCEVLDGVLRSPEVFRLVSGESDSPGLGLSTSGQFRDSSDNDVSFGGRYFKGILNGELTIRTPGGRVVVANMSLRFTRSSGDAVVLSGDIVVVSDTDGECLDATASVTMTLRRGSSDPKEVFEQCGPVDIVFAMDTSGSMGDEGLALCAQIDGVLKRLNDLGLTDIRVLKWGITADADDDSDFPCLTDNVKDVFNDPEVPGMPGRFLNLRDSDEDWGPATAIVSELGSGPGFSFQWRLGALRIFIPISDEGPSNGDPSGEAEDAAVIANAIRVAKRNNVIVSPIIGDGAEPFVSEHARDLADGTGGIAVRSADPDLDIGGLIFDIVFASCGGIPLPPEPRADPGKTILVAITKGSNLYSLNSESGALTAIGPVFVADVGEIGLSISSMIFNEETSQLWAGTGGQASCAACIYTIAPNRSASFNADNSEEAAAHPGLAQRRSDGLILGFPGENDSDLLALNPQSGVAVQYADDLEDIFDDGYEGVGITFVGERCYAAIHEFIVEIDPFSGFPRNPLPIKLVGFPTDADAIVEYHIKAMTTRPSDNKVFCIVNDRDDRTYPQGRSSEFLASVNVKTGVVTNIGNLSMRLDGLTWVPADYFSPLRVK